MNRYRTLGAVAGSCLHPTRSLICSSRPFSSQQSTPKPEDAQRGPSLPRDSPPSSIHHLQVRPKTRKRSVKASRLRNLSPRRVYSQAEKDTIAKLHKLVKWDRITRPRIGFSASDAEATTDLGRPGLPLHKILENYAEAGDADRQMIELQAKDTIGDIECHHLTRLARQPEYVRRQILSYLGAQWAKIPEEERIKGPARDEYERLILRIFLSPDRFFALPHNIPNESRKQVYLYVFVLCC